MTELENALYDGKKDGYDISIPADFKAWSIAKISTRRIDEAVRKANSLAALPDRTAVSQQIKSLHSTLNKERERLEKARKLMDKTTITAHLDGITAFSGQEVRELHKTYKTAAELYAPWVNADPAVFQSHYEETIRDGIDTLFEWRRFVKYLVSIRVDGETTTFTDDGQKLDWLKTLQDPQLFVLFRLLDDVFVDAGTWEGKVESVDF